MGQRFQCCGCPGKVLCRPWFALRGAAPAHPAAPGAVGAGRDPWGALRGIRFAVCTKLGFPLLAGSLAHFIFHSIALAVLAHGATCPLEAIKRYNNLTIFQ